MIDWRTLLGLKRRPAKDGAPEEPYRIFTRAYDVELAALDIPEKLRSISPDRREWCDEQGVAWQKAQDQASHFITDQIPTNDAIRAVLGSDAASFAVTFLIDQSGSMKGKPICAVAASVSAVQSALAAAGASTEVLGFSTAGWRGGFARDKWLRSGRPRRPGRLCALLHVIYKSAGETEWLEQSKRAMLHPDLLRENIDGEALDWAASRLAALPHAHKLLIVMSDGAPVDDSTLMENGPSYLWRDMLRAISQIQNGGIMTLGALGIGYAVDRIYPYSREGDVDTLPAALTLLFADLMSNRQTPSRL
ncbi:cobaltochelatase CobT-related protein [Sphingomonas sp.]|jgi:cobaltochelatase CobT|uniref:cobaltochelatase CobT-related protein n=1 Tax=Sphingomonas sp. TaxID=28214 RepID=UPI002EDA7F10